MAMSRCLGAASVTSSPPIRMLPSVTSSRPAIMRRSVVLPQPDGPTSTRNSPSAISRLTSSTATTPPANSFVTRSMPIAAIARRIVQAIPLPIQGEIGFDHFAKVAYTPVSVDLDELITEERSDDARDLDLRSTRELVELMAQLDAAVPRAVESAGGATADVIEEVVERLRSGGRLVYVGAGSSGRQAAADAAECEATFGTPAGLVIAVFAGDDDSVEDDAEAGAAAIRALTVGPADAVVGISASGRTPYVVGAIEAAAGSGAFTAGVVSAPGSSLASI